MFKILISILISFFAMDVIALNDPYQDYLLKTFASTKVTQNTQDLQLNSNTGSCFQELDQLLDTDRMATYRGEFKFQLDQLGYVETLELISKQEEDFEKFKTFVTEVTAIKFPDCLARNKVYSLEGQSLYVDREDELLSLYGKASSLQGKPSSLRGKPSSLRGVAEAIQKPNFTQENQIATDFHLVKPKYLDYPYLGQELIFKNQDDVYVKAYITKTKSSKIFLKAYQVYNQEKTQALNLDFEIERNDDKNLLTEIVGSGFANALKAGILNSYNSYGIAPGLLAIAGMTGTALIENETEDSFALEQGQGRKIKLEIGLNKKEKKK